jgi:HJR/Mrr/RecB family endonuclease
METLRMVLTLHPQVDSAPYVELVPYFVGAPHGWRAAFLDSTELPEVYVVPNRKALAQVDVDIEVRPLVLEARRLAGRTAKAHSVLPRHLQIIDQTDLEDMSPEAFEHLCALIYRKNGFSNSFRVGGSGDGGVDVVCLRGAQGLLLQCKSSKELDKRLGWEGVKDVVAGEAGYRVKHPFVAFQKMSLTNQYFNESAKSQASLNDVLLMDKTSMLKEIRRLHISYLELRFFAKGAV